MTDSEQLRIHKTQQQQSSQVGFPYRANSGYIQSNLLSEPFSSFRAPSSVFLKTTYCAYPFLAFSPPPTTSSEAVFQGLAKAQDFSKIITPHNQHIFLHFPFFKETYSLLKAVTHLCVTRLYSGQFECHTAVHLPSLFVFQITVNL